MAFTEIFQVFGVIAPFIWGIVTYFIKRHDNIIKNLKREWEQLQADLEVRVQDCEKERDELCRRVASLEVSLSTNEEFRWSRHENGVFLSLTKKASRIIAGCNGYLEKEILGKRLEDLKKLPEEFISCLREMDKEILAHGYSVRHGVTVAPSVVATIIKTSCVLPSGESVYVGQLCPEDGPTMPGCSYEEFRREH